jgi:hypothetical protein
MNYGDILSDAFKKMWEEKKLWMISALGVALFALMSIIYSGGMMGWQMRWMQALPALENAGPEQEPIDWAIQIALGYMTMFGFMSLFSLGGYIINLIARAGVVSEALRAFRGERTDISRGLSQGARKAPAFFAIDLLWSLPLIAVMLAGIVLVGILAGGAIARISANGGDEFEKLFPAMFGGFFFVMTAFICLSLLYGAFKGVFAPLMYQAAAEGDKPLGEAIREGWRLSRENLGPMIVMLILFWAAMLGLGLVIRILSMPLSLMFMFPWFSMMNSLEAGAQPAGIQPLNWLLLFIGVVGAGAFTWLGLSLRQTIYLTLYARVYQELKDAKSLAETTQ